MVRDVEVLCSTAGSTSLPEFALAKHHLGVVSATSLSQLLQVHISSRNESRDVERCFVHRLMKATESRKRSYFDADIQVQRQCPAADSDMQIVSIGGVCCMSLEVSHLGGNGPPARPRSQAQRRIAPLGRNATQRRLASPGRYKRYRR